MSNFDLKSLPGSGSLNGLVVANGANPATALKVNLAATTAPNLHSDSSGGYTVGSLWINTTLKDVYLCASAAVGAAVWKKVNQWIPTLLDFGALGNSSDDSVKIQAALNSGFKYIIVPAGYVFGTSTYLTIPDGVSLIGQGYGSQIKALNNIPNYVPFGSNHQGQIFIFLGNHSQVGNLYVNGADYNAGGACVFNTASNSVNECWINNTGGCQAILDTLGVDCQYKGNRIKHALHGVQLWRSTGAVVSANQINTVSGGGVFCADAQDVNVCGNVVANCGDVGIDLEGGVNCLAEANIVSACNNGELTVFKNGTGSGRVGYNLSFIGNTVNRTATFLYGVSSTPTATNVNCGALEVYSIDAGNVNICYKHNVINVQASAGTGIKIAGLDQVLCGVTFDSNKVTSASNFLDIDRAYGVSFLGNEFHGLVGAEANANIARNVAASIWDDNTFIYDVAPSGGVYAFYYFTDEVSGLFVSPLIKDNTFSNCGDNAFKHDPFTSGLYCEFENNHFSDTYQPNGGFLNVIASGSATPLYRNQQFLLKMPVDGNPYDFAGHPIFTTYELHGKGILQVIGGDLAGSSYEIVFIKRGSESNVFVVSRDGSGPGSGIGADPNRYATFSGSTITLTSTSSNQEGALAVTLNNAY